MPVPIIGAGLVGLANLGRAGMMGYRAFRTAQTARKAAGAGRTISETGKQITKGLGRLERKYPTAAGTFEAATTLPLAAEGSYEAAKGVVEGRPGDVMSGIGSTMIGLGLLPRAGRLFGISRKVPKGARKGISETSRMLDKGLPKGTTLAGFGAVGAGTTYDVFAGEPVPADQVGKDRFDIILDNYERNKGVKFTPEQRKKAKNAIKADPSFAPKGVPTEDFSDYLEGAEGLGGTQPKTSKTVQPGSQRDADTLVEIDKADKVQKKSNAKLAQNLKDKEEFKKYYDSIMDISGGNEDTANLLLLKFASGLMSGKTGKSGFAGLVDVAGQAVGPVADTAIALASKERENKKDMAVAYIKAKEKSKEKLGAGGLSEKTFMRLIEDPMAIGGQKAIETRMFKDGQYQGYEAAWDPKSQTYVPIDPANAGARIEYDKGAIATLGYEMDALAAAQKMTDLILQTPNELVGVGGGIRSVSDNAILSAKEILATTLGANYGGSTEKAIGSTFLETGKGNQTSELLSYDDAKAKYEANVQKRIKELEKKMKPGLFGMNAQQRARIAELAVIETNLAYAYANALKGKDRLTEKNIDDAMKTVQIFGLRNSEQVKERIKAVQSRINESFDMKVGSYQAAGGSNQVINKKYGFMPIVKRSEIQRNNVAAQLQAQQQANKIIEGIQF